MNRRELLKSISLTIPAISPVKDVDVDYIQMNIDDGNWPLEIAIRSKAHLKHILKNKREYGDTSDILLIKKIGNRVGSISIDGYEEIIIEEKCNLKSFEDIDKSILDAKRKLSEVMDTIERIYRSGNYHYIVAEDLLKLKGF